MTTLTFDPELDKPGCWMRVKAKGKKPSALVSCPTCEETVSLSGHFIFYDGKVTPSLVCPHENCGFHDWIVLEGWKP